MADDDARAELEWRVAERLASAFKTGAEEWLLLPPELSEEDPQRAAWLIVAREALEMCSRVAVEAHRGMYAAAAESHWARHRGCARCAPEVPAILLSAALEDGGK